MRMVPARSPTRFEYSWVPNPYSRAAVPTDATIAGNRAATTVCPNIDMDMACNQKPSGGFRRYGWTPLGVPTYVSHGMWGTSQ
jgi:hypothetical protein